MVELAEECPVVYKYQSGDSIMREVMACYCEQSGGDAGPPSWGQGLW